MSGRTAARFDYVCAPLACPACGGTAERDCEIDLQTKIAREPAGRELRIGDEVTPLEDLRDADYLPLGDAPSPDRLNVIEAWSCPLCGAGPLWARITLVQGRIEAVLATDLSLGELERADYLSSEALVLVPLDEVPELKALPPAELRKRLAEAP